MPGGMKWRPIYTALAQLYRAISIIGEADPFGEG
jgi:hypothetical protein